MSSSNTNEVLKPILEELEEIGASTNSSIDIILNEMQKQNLDVKETANFLIHNFPNKTDEIAKKLKEISGIEIKTPKQDIKPQNIAQKASSENCMQNKTKELTPELQKLQELYAYVPKPFWQKVITTAEQFKKMTESF